MTTYLPSPFPKKGVTPVQPLSRLPVFDWPPAWDGPAQAAKQ
jgi:hypothetical protein